MGKMYNYVYLSTKRDVDARLDLNWPISPSHLRVGAIDSRAIISAASTRDGQLCGVWKLRDGRA